jgi:HD-GYP domain-containing protein (c-di-GMP phosphodiesterase class II)
MLFTITNILISLLFLTSLCLTVYIFLTNKRFTYRINKLKYKLNIAEKKLQINTINIDRLILVLSGIHNFGIAVTGVSEKEELANICVETACSILHSDRASLLLLNSENKLYMVATKGLSEQIKKDILIKPGEGIAGQVAKTGKYIFVENIENDTRFLRTNTSKRYNSKSFISIPLKVKNKVIGVLNITSSKNRQRFKDKDLKLIMLLADQFAMKFDNIELFNDLQSFYFEMIQTLARAIDAKDAYTYDHADRTRKYAKKIALRMNLPSSIIKNIEFAALMHDIGKIGISDDILLKKEHLTVEETETIKKHAVIGYNILEPVQFLKSVAPMVLYHQEWYDGKGYPEGLEKEEIPLGARIISVIDSYDAMTSDRPYRKAMPLEKAISELKKGSGIQFDPKVVNIFIDILEKEKNIN